MKLPPWNVHGGSWIPDSGTVADPSWIIQAGAKQVLLRVIHSNVTLLCLAHLHQNICPARCSRATTTTLSYQQLQIYDEQTVLRNCCVRSINNSFISRRANTTPQLLSSPTHERVAFSTISIIASSSLSLSVAVVPSAIFSKS